MSISNKKRKYIKRFASTKTPEQLCSDTGLAMSSVQKVLKDLGYVVDSNPVREKTHPTGEPFVKQLFWLFFSMALLVSPLFFISGLYDMYSLPKSSFLAILAPITAITFIVYALSQKNFSVVNCIKQPALPLILFVIYALLSLLWGINKYSGILSLESWMCLSIFFFVSLNFYKGFNHVKIVSTIMTLAGVAVAAIGIFQFFGKNPSFLYQAAIPGSTFGNKNFAAQFVVAIIPFSIYTAYLYREKRTRVLFGLLPFTLIFFLMITRTRGAWLASIAGLLTAAGLLIFYFAKNNFIRKIELKNILGKQFIKHIMPGLVFFIILISFTLMPSEKKDKKSINLDFGQELKSIAKTKEGSAHWRLTAWTNTLEMIKDKPFFGTGIGNWQFYYPLFAQKGAVDKDFNEDRQAKRAHNDYLQITAELGLPGLILFLCFLISVIFCGFKIVRSDESQEWAFLGIAGISAIISIMGNAMFSFPFQEALPPFFLSVIASMITFGRFRKTERKKIRSKPILVALLIFFIILAVFNIVWGYRLCKADYYFLEGKRYNKSNMFERSLRPLRQSMKLNPHNFRVYSLLGRSFNELKRYHDSVPINKKALELHPYYINCMNNLGNALRGIHHVDESIEVYNKALELFPNFAEAHNNLGIAFKEKKDIKASIKEYEKAIEIDPSYEKAYNNLGNILLSQNKVDKAIEYYKKTIQLDPKLPDVYNNMGLALIRKKQFEDAIESFDTCIKLNSRLADPHNNKGSALKSLERLDEAILQFKKAIMINSSYLPAHNNLAEIYVKQKDFDKAIEQYETILQMNPTIQSFYTRTADIYMKIYAQNQSIETLDKAIALMEVGIGYYPKNATFHTVLGKIYIDSKQNAKALEMFQQVIILAPDKPESYYNLGIIYHKNKDFKQAVKYYKIALERNPDFIFLHYEICKLYEQMRMYTEALKEARIFLEKWDGESRYKKRAEKKVENLEKLISEKKN